MKIYFVRHGQTQMNKEGRCTGQIDVPLLEEGKKEAKSAELLLPRDLDIIFCSDSLRCRETAEILNSNLGIPIFFDPRLRERNFGSLAGTLVEELGRELREKDKHQEYDYSVYGGESATQVKERVLDMISEIVAKHKDKKVLVVTHGGVVRLLHKVIGNEIKENIINSSIHEFDF